MSANAEQSLETRRREQFLEQVNVAYAELRADREAWSGIEAARREWDAALADGLTPAEAAAT
jgi:hypothetical protein